MFEKPVDLGKVDKKKKKEKKCKQTKTNGFP